jgi:hypothetical protein
LGSAADSGAARGAYLSPRRRHTRDGPTGPDQAAGIVQAQGANTMNASIGNNSIKLEGFKYFVGKASSVTIGSWGDKKSPVMPGEVNYIDVWDVLYAPKLAEVKFITAPITVEFSDEKGINLFAALKVPGLASGKVGLKVSDFTSGKVKLVKVSPAGDSEWVKQYNSSPKIIDKLVDFGGSARIVKDVLIVVEAVFYNKFSAAVANNGSVIVDGLMVSAKREAGWDKSNSIEIGPGVVAGYSLAEPKWNASQDKNKTQITSLRDDQAS